MNKLSIFFLFASIIFSSYVQSQILDEHVVSTHIIDYQDVECLLEINNQFAFEVEEPYSDDDAYGMVDFGELKHFVQVSLNYNRDFLSDEINQSDWRLEAQVGLRRVDAGGATTQILIGNETLAVYHDPNNNQTGDRIIDWLNVTLDENDLLSPDLFVLYIYGINCASGDCPDDIHVELEFICRRDYSLENHDLQIESEVTNTAEEQYIDLSWDQLYGVSSYEIQYYFDDIQGGANDGFEDALSIITDCNTHRMDLVFPEGTVHFRVRGLGSDYSVTNENCAATSWSTNTISVSTSFENDKNWQSKIQYAEEGKNKRIVTILDNSNRPMQTTTLLNHEGVAMVADQYHDLEGRSTISILPAPEVEVKNIEGNAVVDYPRNYQYKYAFNQALNSTDAYSYENHENSLITALNDQSGAGRYYSKENFQAPGAQVDLEQFPNHNLIPDAEGFPMSKMRYKNDNTGKTTLQSGVGEPYQLGSGHETKFFHIGVSPSELKRLFGDEIGVASHYKKQIVIDPNGQASASYLNLSGNVVATSLLGNAPSNVQELESYQPYQQTFTNDLLTDNASDHFKILGVNEFFLEFDQTVSFDYNLSGEEFSYMLKELMPDDTEYDAEYCTSCGYLISFYLLDECGEFIDLNITNSGGLMNEGDNQNPRFRIDEETVKDQANCSGSNQGIVITFSTNGTISGPSNYQLIKELTPIPIDVEALYTRINESFEVEKYEENLRQVMLDSFFDSGKFLECFESCEEFFRYTVVNNHPELTEEADIQNSIDTLIDNNPEYEEIEKLCEEQKDSIILSIASEDCENIRRQLLYSTTCENLNTSPEGTDDSDVYHLNESLTFIVENATDFFVIVVLDENFHEIEIRSLGGGNFEFTNLTTEIAVNSFTARNGALIQNTASIIQDLLLDCSVFETRWQSAFVNYHKELCKYQDCLDRELINRNSFRWASLETYDDVLDELPDITVTPDNTVAYYENVLQEFTELDEAAFNDVNSPYCVGQSQDWSYAANYASNSGIICLLMEEGEDACKAWSGNANCDCSLAQHIQGLITESGQTLTDMELFYSALGHYLEARRTRIDEKGCLENCDRPEAFSVIEDIPVVRDREDLEKLQEDLRENWDGAFEDETERAEEELEDLIGDTLTTSQKNTFEDLFGQLVCERCSGSKASSFMEEYFTDPSDTLTSSYTIANCPLNEEYAAIEYFEFSPSQFSDQIIDIECLDPAQSYPSLVISSDLLCFAQETPILPPPGTSMSGYEDTEVTQYRLTLNPINSIDYPMVNTKLQHDTFPQLYVEIRDGNNHSLLKDCDRNTFHHQWKSKIVEFDIDDPLFVRSDYDIIIYADVPLERINTYNGRISMTLQRIEYPKKEYEYRTYDQNGDVVLQSHDFMHNYNLEYIHNLEEFLVNEPTGPQISLEDFDSWISNYWTCLDICGEPSDCANDLITEINKLDDYLTDGVGYDIMTTHMDGDVVDTFSFFSPEGVDSEVCGRKFQIIDGEDFYDFSGPFLDEAGCGSCPVEIDTPSVRYQYLLLNGEGETHDEIIYFLSEDGYFLNSLYNLTDVAYVSNKIHIVDARTTTDLPEHLDPYVQDDDNLKYSGLMLLIRHRSNSSLVPLNTDPHRYQRVYMLKEVPADTMDYVYNLHCDPRPTSRDTQIMECIENYTNLVQNSVNEYVNEYVLRKIDTILNDEENNCFDVTETFKQTLNSREHHFTLYYYDQAGNLIQTTPPEAFETSPTSTAGVYTRDNNYSSTYQYNSFNQIELQEAPERGETEMWYDRLQNPRFSQNARQRAENTYTYMKYDDLNRLIEQGEFFLADANHLDVIIDADDKDYPRADQSLQQHDIVLTYYSNEAPLAAQLNIDQGVLRNRISYQERRDSYDANADIVTCAYAYDVHGNVKTLMHDYPWYSNNPVIHYDYDLISGNVHEVIFEVIRPSSGFSLPQLKYYHRYLYDDDNRITQVYTSKDGLNWQEQARYFYYLHGPMARVEIGNDKIQGMDYAYTLQGWIKGVNLPGMDTEANEPGHDGYRFDQNQMNNPHGLMGQDAMAYQLGYNEEDYQSISTAETPTTPHPLDAYAAQNWGDMSSNILNSSTSTEGLYNGNIASMSSDLKLLTADIDVNSYAYQYDQLHRIMQSKSYDYDGYTSSYNGDFDTEYTLDQNGNLLNLTRNTTDDIDYTYGIGAKPNQLSSIDNIPSGSVPDDAYTYDAIGNLITSNEATTIEWDHYDKVSRVVNNSGEEKKFFYDPMGNRIFKEDEVFNGKDDLYIRDAQGNVLAILDISYEGSDTDMANDINHHIYGSDRIGTDTRPLGNLIDYSPNIGEYRRQRNYEIKNHLGNVLTTVFDQKLFDPNGAADNLEGHYVAQAVTISDYYPFGHPIEDRSMSTNFGGAKHRYGFNDKEQDSDGEWGSSTTAYDYGFRIYNPGIARFLSVDPMASSFPFYTPYQFAGNMPIWAIDLEGLQPYKVTDETGQEWDGSPVDQANIPTITANRIGSTKQDNTYTTPLDLYSQIRDRVNNQRAKTPDHYWQQGDNLYTTQEVYEQVYDRGQGSRFEERLLQGDYGVEYATGYMKFSVTESIAQFNQTFGTILLTISPQMWAGGGSRLGLRINNVSRSGRAISRNNIDVGFSPAIDDFAASYKTWKQNRAPVGGARSSVNGEWYTGGQFMPGGRYTYYGRGAVPELNQVHPLANPLRPSPLFYNNSKFAKTAGLTGAGLGAIWGIKKISDLQK